MEKATEDRGRGQYPHIVRCRVSEEQRQRLAEAAETAGMSVGRYARHRLAGSHVSSKVELQMLNELRRVGGLIKKLAAEGKDLGDAGFELIRVARALRDHIGPDPRITFNNGERS